MVDRKKVIKGLECLAQKQVPMANPCKDCGYSDRLNYAICVKDIASDALELLKEQEAKPMLEVDEDDDLYAWSPGDVSYYCPRPECGKEISYDYNFCPYCGQAVKLDD